MAITNIRLPRTSLGNVAFAPLGQTRVVTTMYLCNTSNVAATANVYLVPSTSNVLTDPIGSTIYTNLPIAPGDTYIVDGERIVLENGDSIFANITTGAAGTVIMTVSSVGT
jgi:hypothetical protein